MSRVRRVRRRRRTSPSTHIPSAARCPSRRCVKRREPYCVIHSFCICQTGTTGAINVDALCQEGAFLVDNISFYSDAAVGTELTAEADWKRRGLYIGPQFDTLDVSVQEEFEAWLKERGVNEALASFVPEYAEWKEQKVRSHLFRMFSMLTASYRSMSAGSSR